MITDFAKYKEPQKIQDVEKAQNLINEKLK